MTSKDRNVVGVWRLVSTRASHVWLAFSAGAGAVNVGFSGNGTVAVNNPGTSLSGGSVMAKLA